MKLTDIIALATQGYKQADIRELSALAEETRTTPSDIVALAKQGYKPGDIRELIALAEETSTKPSEDPTDPAPAPVIEPEPEEPAAAAETAGPKQSEMLDKVNKLENQLKSLQENNTRRPRPEEPPKKSDEAILKDMVRRFM